MQAECLRSQIAPLAARCRSCSSNRQRTSAAQCPGSQFAPLAARYRSCSSNRQRTSAAQCLGSQFAPWQLAIARAHQALTHARGPVPGLSIRAPGSSLSLVLIEPPTHVRGPVPGLSIRAPGSSLPLVLIEPPAHVRAGGCVLDFLRPRTLYFTGPALDFCEFSLNFPCIFGKIGTRKQPLSQIY